MCISAATMMALSTGVSVVGQVMQGRAQAKAASIEAQQLELQAAQQREAARQEAENIRRAGEKQAGAARAALAGAGVDVGSGTAININEDIYQGSEMDAYNTLLTGGRTADATSFRASQTYKAGSNALTSSLLSAGTTALSGWKGVRAANKQG